MILYNEWVCDEWWFTCSHYLDSVQDGSTALYVAAENGHVDAVGLLVAAKAQLNIQQKVRFTACLLVIINLDVYRMVWQHCTWPVRRVTVKLFGCWWWPGLTWTWRLMWVTLHGGVCVLCWFHGWVQRRIVKLQRTLIAFQSSTLSLVPPTTLKLTKDLRYQRNDRNAIIFIRTQILIQTFWPCLSSSGLSVVCTGVWGYVTCDFNFLWYTKFLFSLMQHIFELWLQFCECASIFAFLFYTPYKLIRPQIYQLHVYCIMIMQLWLYISIVHVAIIYI